MRPYAGYAFLLAVVLVLDVSAATVPRLGGSIAVAPVWPGHPVNFDLLSDGTSQFVAFYDTSRWMTIGTRPLDTDAWSFVRLPSQLGWDSHNYVTMGIDCSGSVHVAGNMHNVPLVYFRTTNGCNLESFVHVPAMTGELEDKSTQPRFFHGTRNELIFMYRQGGSGNADNLFNVYDESSRTWRRLFGVPLLSGEGRRSAYPYGPSPGPDGFFHLVWVWRDSPDCGSNHDLCYARSRDFAEWESSAGRALPLPIVASASEVIEPVPPGGGMLNGNTMLAFDASNRPVVTFHRYDTNGMTQLYQARLEQGRWQLYQTTKWQYRWELSGKGFLSMDILFRPLVRAPGVVLQWYRHAYYGEGILVLDDASLEPKGELVEPLHPPELDVPLSPVPGMKVQWQMDRGPARQCWLRWETLDYNRDEPRTGPIPQPSMLRLYAFTPLSELDVGRLKPVRPSPLIATVVLTNLVRDGVFGSGLAAWKPWQAACIQTSAVRCVPCTGVTGVAAAVRIGNAAIQLIGIKQEVSAVSGATYRLSGLARSTAAADPAALFGGRLALNLPGEPEREIVWMNEDTRWQRRELVFTPATTGAGTLFVHMGYGNVTGTGEFADVRLEQVVVPRRYDPAQSLR